MIFWVAAQCLIQLHHCMSTKIGIPLQLPGGQKPVIDVLKGQKKFAQKTRQ
jgi:hypothetical protein